MEKTISLEEVYCNCRKDTSKREPLACCRQCPFCKRKIKRGFFKEHVDNHRKKALQMTLNFPGFSCPCHGKKGVPK